MPTASALLVEETDEETDSSPPKVIVMTTIHWASTTRLCLALAEGGFSVHVIAPDDHAVHRMTGFITTRLGRTRRQAMATIARCVAAFRPALLVPADEQAIGLLREAHVRAIRGRGPDPRFMAGLIEASLGPPSSLKFAYQKSRFVSLARSEGLLVPETTVVRSVDALRGLTARATFPIVLKQDESYGGRAVRIAGGIEEAIGAFIELRAAAGPLSGLKTAIKKLDHAWLDRLWRHEPAITLQQYVPGRPANCAVACWRGEILAGITVEVLETTSATSPATVVRVIDSPSIGAAAACMTRRLGLSGFVGFDFVLEALSGRSFLIEMNARPTQICHIAMDARSDMIGALIEALTGAPARRRKMPTVSSRTVALFPQETWRDPGSGYLSSAHHDVPPQSPEFALAYREPVPAEPPTWLDVTRRLIAEAGSLFSRPVERATTGGSANALGDAGSR